MKIKAAAIILTFALLATVLCSCNILPTFYTLKYTASEGGTIVGETEQTVEEGKDGESVMAIADDGYFFVAWSDGLTESIRQETNVSGNLTVTAQFESIGLSQQPTTFTVKYLCNEGGSIQGQTTQTVEQGQDATAVTAVADEGYEFVKWSDGVATTTRQDKNISGNLTLTAVFKEIEQPAPLTKTYTLNYNFGEADEKPEQITFVENEIEGIALPILTREHFTFHGWYCNEEQVADTNGNLLLGEELLTLDGEEIYAKWTANETFIYKILLVYVTRIDAVLPHKDPSVTETVHVDYTMSEQEREFCHLLTIRTKERMDEMMDGLVEFQVDEYYTSKTFTNDDFHTSVGNIRYSALYLKEVAEVSNILPQYDSGLILYNAKSETRMSTGAASSRYGEVRLDSFYESMEAYNFTLEEAIELMKSDDYLEWRNNTYLVDGDFLEPIRHELAHTIEQRMNLGDYHNVVNGVYKTLGHFESNRMYYLNEAMIEGIKIGIPYEFWKGDIAKCSYLVTEGKNSSQGYVSINRLGIYTEPVGSGNLFFDALYGEYVTVTAIPFAGCKFVQWSDGVTTAERTDLITENFTVTAIFETIS